MYRGGNLKGKETKKTFVCNPFKKYRKELVKLKTSDGENGWRRAAGQKEKQKN